MTLRILCLSLALILLGTANAATENAFCLKAPDGDGFYSGCTETQLPHAATPKVICLDPANPKRFATPSASAAQNWTRTAEGAQNWCPKAQGVAGGKSPIRGDSIQGAVK